MSYEVKIREIAPIEAMTVRFVTNMGSISDDMTAAFKEIWEFTEKKGLKSTGDCFALYHTKSASDFDPENIDAECGFSVAKTAPGEGRISGRTIEGVSAAVVTHKGSYATLSGAYEAIGEWAPANGYELLAGWRDYYLNDPSTLPPEEWLTEVACPVRKIG